jgi:hypothetical protein
MDKKEETISTDSLAADALVRIKTVENMLIAKGIFTREEYNAEMKEVVKTIAKNILIKANITGNLDEMVESMLGQNVSIQDFLSKKDAN